MRLASLPRTPLPRKSLVLALGVAAAVLVPAGLLVQRTLVGGSGGTKVVAPPPRVEPQGPPACEYRDLRAGHTSYDDWARTLLDTTLRLPRDYEPPDLVPTTRAGLGTKRMRVREIALADLSALAQAAEAAGNPVDVTWGYRSFRTQRWVFDYWTRRKGDEALKTAARPGHSEHQLGTALDFKTRGAPDVDLGWRYEPAGIWMREHAWELGFVESYPLGAEDMTCYAHEPWHYRYFGRERAAEIHESGLTPREFLWRELT